MGYDYPLWRRSAYILELIFILLAALLLVLSCSTEGLRALLDDYGMPKIPARRRRCRWSGE